MHYRHGHGDRKCHQTGIFMSDHGTAGCEYSITKNILSSVHISGSGEDFVHYGYIQLRMYSKCTRLTTSVCRKTSFLTHQIKTHYVRHCSVNLLLRTRRHSQLSPHPLGRFRGPLKNVPNERKNKIWYIYSHAQPHRPDSKYNNTHIVSYEPHIHTQTCRNCPTNSFTEISLLWQQVSHQQQLTFGPWNWAKTFKQVVWTMCRVDKKGVRMISH